MIEINGKSWKEMDVGDKMVGIFMLPFLLFFGFMIFITALVKFGIPIGWGYVVTCRCDQERFLKWCDNHPRWNIDIKNRTVSEK